MRNPRQSRPAHCGDDGLSAGRERTEYQVKRRGGVGRDEGVFRSGKLAQELTSVILPDPRCPSARSYSSATYPAASASASRARPRAGRAQVGMQHHAGRVDHPGQRRPVTLLESPAERAEPAVRGWVTTILTSRGQGFANGAHQRPAWSLAPKPFRSASARRYSLPATNAVGRSLSLPRVSAAVGAGRTVSSSWYPLGRGAVE